MKKTLLLLLSFALTGIAMSQGVYQPGGKFVPEASQARVQEQQRLQRTQPEIGSTPLTGDPAASVESEGDDPDAAAQVAAAERDITPGRTNAEQALATAREEIEKRPSGGGLNTGVLAIFVLALGFGAVFGVLKWLEQSSPNKPTRTSPPSRKLQW